MNSADAPAKAEVRYYRHEGRPKVIRYWTIRKGVVVYVTYTGEEFPSLSTEEVLEDKVRIGELLKVEHHDD